MKKMSLTIKIICSLLLVAIGLMWMGGTFITSVIGLIRMVEYDYYDFWDYVWQIVSYATAHSLPLSTTVVGVYLFACSSSQAESKKKDPQKDKKIGE